MIFKSDLPNNFKPYKKLTICSNLLIDCKFVISLGDKIPILIGTNHKPLIWLSAMVDVKKKHYQDLVIASEATHPLITVEEIGKFLNIFAKKQLVVSISSEIPDSAIVHKLDLRPIGINIFGDENALIVGKNQLSSNTFQNVETMIGLGEP
jgi:hypothetical protein